jgi:hypothetical protein
MFIQLLCMAISIGGAPDAGSRLVPEPVRRRMFSVNEVAGPPMFMLVWASACGNARRIPTANIQRKTETSGDSHQRKYTAAHPEPPSA